MAVFLRQNALVGDSAYRTMLCGSDSTSTSYTGNVIRINKSDIIKVSGVYTSGHDSKFVPASRGRRVQATKNSTARNIVLNFLCGDPTGFEQSAIKAFFTYDRKITYTDAERSIPPMALYVVSIDDSFYADGNDSIAITCTAEYDDFSSSQDVTLYSYEGTTWPTISYDFTNALAIPASVRMTIGTTDGSTASFKASKITMNASSNNNEASGSITYTLGNTSGTYVGTTVVMDSLDEVVKGKAYIDPSSTQKFFSVPYGVKTTITVPAPSIFPLGKKTKIELSAFYTAPQGMYANDFSVKPQ